MKAAQKAADKLLAVYKKEDMVSRVYALWIMNISLLYAMKKCSKPISSSVECMDGKVIVNISNDGVKNARGSGILYLIDNSGSIIKTHKFDVNSISNESYIAFSDDCSEFKADGKAVYVCDIKTDIGSDRSFFPGVKPSDLKSEKANVEITKNENKVILKSDKTAFYVKLCGNIIFDRIFGYSIHKRYICNSQQINICPQWNRLL